MKAVRGNTSLLPSLAGVRGPSGCAVQQNSKSDPVQELSVLELEERLLLHRCWSYCIGEARNHLAAAMITIQVMEVLARRSMAVRARGSIASG